jgi:protein phosphatase
VIAQRPIDRGVLFMVADGMGGAAAGEVASEMAVTTVLAEMRQRWRGQPAHGALPFVDAMRAATQSANASIHRHASEHAELRGMGTTATIAGLLGDTLYLAQVGDSRAYLVRDGAAIQITKDQSLMQRLLDAGEITREEAEQSERRNIILQALGPESVVKVDITHQRVRRGDTLILCSDGLSSLVRAEQIAQVVRDEPELERVCGRLIELANAAGGPDNITVVAARFSGEGLEEASAVDVVGHQHFGAPDPITPLSVPAVLRPPGMIPPAETPSEEPPAPPVVQPQPPLSTADEDRQRLGRRYTRIIGGVAAVLLVLLVWHYLTRP